MRTNDFSPSDPRLDAEIRSHLDYDLRGHYQHVLVEGRLDNESADRARTRWDAYRYAANSVVEEIPAGFAAPDGQAVPLITGVHPAAQGTAT